MTDHKSTEYGKGSANGVVTKAFGNLLHVQFRKNGEGSITQGEVAFIDLGNRKLKAEVIEIAGDFAKIQVFEDTRGVFCGAPVHFSGHMLEAELGPGLLKSICDGLQNPLEGLKEAMHGDIFLPVGKYLPSLDRTTYWHYEPRAKIKDRLERGDTLGVTSEGRFEHLIMLPFAIQGKIEITWVAPSGNYTVDHVIAKGVDAQGHEHRFTMVQKWPIKMPILLGEKMRPTEMMDTGLRICDTQFPMLKGGTFCSPGPFGAGKTVLQHHLAKYSSVDIVIVCACGERAGEVVEVLKEFPELTDTHTGKTLMERTVIICNTSSMPVAAREASVYLGVTIAEYYRQMGLDVLLLADSTSRWAQAMREMSGRLEEIPGEEAFPAYLASRIAAFYERSGVVRLKNGKKGSVTIGGAVSPAGGNFEEPVTQATLAVVGAFLGLSRARSDARRYPSIDPLISWSKYVNLASKELEHKLEGWGDKVKVADKILRTGDEVGKRMEVVGEMGTAIDDMVVYLKAELYDFSFLQQNAFDKEDSYCPLERQVMLFKLISQILKKKFFFATHDEARTFFIALQSKLKNMNFIKWDTDRYHKAYQEIQVMIDQAK